MYFFKFFIFTFRTIIRNAVRANERDAVIFTGGGVTSAVHKLINGLDLDKPPVVFVGPYEHHSNLLPWRTIAVQVNYVYSLLAEVFQSQYSFLNNDQNTAIKSYC